MLLSVVTGTYNRLKSLQRMVDSAHAQLSRCLDYEFVVVDGGSTDGTIEWCKSQSNIRLIEHGELRGAIKAFCDGARAATGEYVVLANDDISFKPYSLLAAIRHLETTPTCGAVAFADNRTSLVHGDGNEYRVEGMGATTHDGKKVMVAYAQVGMFRRELGNVAGWWGDTDPIMRYARTYGGDNYLSARIWEMGYSVEGDPLCVVEDMIERDHLRQVNASTGSADSTLYYERFPTVQLTKTLNRYPTTERLRILNMPVYEGAYPGKKNIEYGMTHALARYGLAFEWDYLNEPGELEDYVKAWWPDLLVTQIQGPGRITESALTRARAAYPQMIIVNWNGDAHEWGLTAPDVLCMLRHIDLQTTVNAKVLPFYAEHGICAAYWQIGYKDPAEPIPDMPAYDVLWQGNCYDDRRTLMVDLLHKLPYNVGIYGNCKGANGNTHYSFAAQRSLYAQARITVGDTFPDTVGFVSNRLFQALAAGAFMLQQHSPHLDELTGLRAGVHYVEWTDLKDLQAKIAHWMRPETTAQRNEIARAGRDFVRANFSYDAQVDKLFTDLLPMIEVQHATA